MERSSSSPDKHIGRSSIGFKRLSDIDLDVLLELIAKARDASVVPSAG